MKITLIKKVVILVILALVSLVQILPVSRIEAQAPPPPTITIIPTVPRDIVGQPTLENAAVFAWQEFIALNWPAVNPLTVTGTPRETPDMTKRFGDSTNTTDVNSPLVWHTFRGKVEIYPGMGNPNGYINDGSKSFGYDAVPPVYVYNKDNTGTSTGLVNPQAGPNPMTPWINLDENSEIGLNNMFAGIGPPTDPDQPFQQILFMAKANRAEYTYVAANQWWSQSRFNGNTPTFAPIINTAKYIQQNGQSPPPGTNTSSLGPVVSFPNGTIEVKAGWRILTPSEASSGRFHTTVVRHYTIQNNLPVYEDNFFGLVALHIIQKTPSSPFFIYATFSQADNLLDVNGNPVEDEDGNLIRNQTATPFDPDITSRNATSANPATANSIQALSPLSSPRVSGTRLYYKNVSKATLTPQGIINLNKRKHDIPAPIIQVNKAAHTAISDYNRANGLTTSPWLYYKLVSVQYQPYDKPAGITYTGAPGGPDPSTYYQANEVVESDYNLQVFSGQFQNSISGSSVNTLNLITDYNPDGTVFKNVYHNGSGYLMGGCMGCHGNAQVSGADFSFIFLSGPVSAPDTVPPAPAPGLSKFRKLLLK
jgi:hypothetical protein